MFSVSEFMKQQVRDDMIILADCVITGMIDTDRSLCEYTSAVKAAVARRGPIVNYVFIAMTVRSPPLFEVDAQHYRSSDMWSIARCSFSQ